MSTTPKKLFKSTIIIWSEYDPSGLEIEDLAQRAMDGDAYCSSNKTQEVSPEIDPDWDQTEFFDSNDEDCCEYDDRMVYKT